MLSPLRVKSGRKLEDSITSAFGGKADVRELPSECLLIARTSHGMTVAAAKRILGRCTTRHLLSVSQHLDKRGQVFLAIPRRDCALEYA